MTLEMELAMQLTRALVANSPMLLCSVCEEHPCSCIKPLGLTRNEIEELSTMAYNTGLRGEALRAKWLSRNIVGTNEKGEPLDGTNIHRALQPGKSKSELPEIIPEEYPGEQLDLFLAVHELYEMGALKSPPGGRAPQSQLLPTHKHKERIKQLMMLYQIVPYSKRKPLDFFVLPKKKRAELNHMSF